MPRAPRSRKIDWPEVERLYRDGLLSIRAIADQCGVSEAAIRKQAGKDGWVRNEADKVRRAAERIVGDRRAAVYQEPGQDRVEVLAKVGADILEAHQRRFGRMQRILDKQVDELERVGDEQPEIEAALEDYFLIKAGGNPEQAGVIKIQMQRALHAVRLPSRAKVLVDLVGAGQKLADMERRAFNLGDGGDSRSYEDLLAEINAKKDAA